MKQQVRCKTCNLLVFELTKTPPYVTDINVGIIKVCKRCTQVGKKKVPGFTRELKFNIGDLIRSTQDIIYV